MKLHLGCGPDILEGFENRDKAIDGWTFQSGLPYENGSVEAITISHALYLLTPAEFTAAIRECYRVLGPGGLIRITEDDTETPSSERYLQPRNLPHDKANCSTGPQQTAHELYRAGFEVCHCTSTGTHFKDRSLLIAKRSLAYVYFVEGIKR